MSTDQADLLRAAYALGYTVDRSGTHLKLSRDDGPVVVLPATPGNGRWARTKTASNLRRHGYGDLANAIARRPPRKRA